MSHPYQPNPTIDALIRDAYSNRNYKNGKTGVIRKLSEKTGWNRHRIYARACELNIPIPSATPRRTGSQQRWSEEEIALLEKHADKTPQRISALLRKHGFNRSVDAIKICIVRNFGGAIQMRVDKGVYTARQAGSLLGVNEHTIRAWIRQGLLDAKRQSDPGDEHSNDRYAITNAAIRRFILNHPAYLRLDRMEHAKFWLIDLLAGTTHTAP